MEGRTMNTYCECNCSVIYNQWEKETLDQFSEIFKENFSSFPVVLKKKEIIKAMKTVDYPFFVKENDFIMEMAEFFSWINIDFNFLDIQILEKDLFRIDPSSDAEFKWENEILIDTDIDRWFCNYDCLSKVYNVEYAINRFLASKYKCWVRVDIGDKFYKLILKNGDYEWTLKVYKYDDFTELIENLKNLSIYK